MRDKMILFFSFVALLVLLLMMNYTTPLSVGVFGVLVFFTMVFVFCFGIMFELIKTFQRILGDGKAVSLNRTYMYATVVAFGPIMLMIIRTFSIVNIFTVMLVAIFVFLGCFLVRKRA